MLVLIVKIFLQHWTSKTPRRSFQILETSSSHREIVVYSDNIINTRLNKRLDITLHDSNLKNKLRRDLTMDVTPYQKYNVVRCSIGRFLNLIDDDSPFPDISYSIDTMESSCLACKKMIKNAIHLCCDVNPSGDKIFACRLFVKRFDLALGEEVNVSVDNLSIDDQNNKHNFFIHHNVAPEKT